MSGRAGGRQREPWEDPSVDMVGQEGDSEMFKELSPTAERRTVKGGGKPGLPTQGQVGGSVALPQGLWPPPTPRARPISCHESFQA